MGKGCRLGSLFDVLLRHMQTDHIDEDENLLLCLRLNEMQQRRAMGGAELCHGKKRQQGGFRDAGIRQNIIRPGLHDLLQQSRNALKMVIKGVAIDLTAVNDIPHGYFFVGLFFQQLPEGIHQKLIGLCHFATGTLSSFRQCNKNPR
jgi:hypothetical protein